MEIPHNQCVVLGRGFLERKGGGDAGIARAIGRVSCPSLSPLEASHSFLRGDLYCIIRVVRHNVGSYVSRLNLPKGDVGTKIKDQHHIR